MSGKRKVLLVEDEYILYQELAEFFEAKGFEITRFDDDRAVDNYEDACKLLKQYEPDFAVLDIRIKGKKDGIELGSFIRKHYQIPVIYLSAFDTYENLDRIRQTGGDGFVIKVDKPVDKKQLWATVQLLLPRYEATVKKRTLGSFFRVKEMDIRQDANRQRITAKEQDDPVEVEKFLKWQDIVFIESFNNKIAGSGNNNILMHTRDANRGYMMRGSLNELEPKLPTQFVRVDQSTIINLGEVTGRNKTGTVYFINTMSFKISDTYRLNALEKIDLFLGTPNMENFPESG
ncbi:MAG: response regulator [Ferruginibacter sp.]